MVIVLFTDFGSADVYVGQVKAVLAQQAPEVMCIDLLHDVPSFGVRPGAYLLDALKDYFPADSVFLAVVDPGVGGKRDAIVLEADGRRYVGPDNGLMTVVAARAAKARWWRMTWRPAVISDSFHGRDLFAPVAAALATGRLPPEWIEALDGPSTDFGSGDLPEVIYIDHYGNAATGLRAPRANPDAVLRVGSSRLTYARVFCDAPTGALFWHANSYGLVEIAQSGGDAAQALGVKIGDPVRWD